MSLQRPPTVRPLRVLCLALLLGSAACAGREEPGVVARVGDWTLSEERLSQLLVLAQPFPLDSASVEGLVRHWIGVAALAGRAEGGTDLTGAEAAEAATWLERRELTLEVEREARMGASVVVGRLDAEVAFRVGDHRLFAHILRRVGPQTPPEERELQRATSERILQDLLAGRSWDDAVTESEDLDTRDASGLLGLFERGELAPELDRVAYRLQPGQISSITETAEGFHILYRPRFEEAADLYAARLRRRQLAEMDAAAGRVLIAQGRVTPGRDAARRVREVAADPWAHLDADGTLASWDGGSLSLGTLARHVVALPDEARIRLTEAGDRAATDFAANVAVRELRLQQAAARGLEPAPADREELAAQHEEEVRYWRGALSLDGGSARNGLADYMERIVSRREEARSLPPLFEAWLLQGVRWSLTPADAVRAAETARRMIAGTSALPPPDEVEPGRRPPS